MAAAHRHGIVHREPEAGQRDAHGPVRQDAQLRPRQSRGLAGSFRQTSRQGNCVRGLTAKGRDRHGALHGEEQIQGQQIDARTEVSRLGAGSTRWRRGQRSCARAERQARLRRRGIQSAATGDPHGHSPAGGRSSRDESASRKIPSSAGRQAHEVSSRIRTNCR